MKRYRIMLTAFALFVLSNVADIVSSNMDFPTAYEETNPWVRTEDHRLDMHKAIVVKSVICLSTGVIGLFCYLALRPAHELVTQVAIAGLYLVLSCYIIFTAVLNNIFLRLGYYVP